MTCRMKERGVNVEPAVLLVNLAYATYAATGLCERMQTLRTVLLISSLLFAGFGLAVGIYSVVASNLGLAVLNARSLAAASTTRPGFAARIRGLATAPAIGTPSAPTDLAQDRAHADQR